jgi:hypothetical protein
VFLGTCLKLGIPGSREVNMEAYFVTTLKFGKIRQPAVGYVNCEVYLWWVLKFSFELAVALTKGVVL